MRITQDLREYAQEHGLDDAVALTAGMAEKARQFREKGNSVYPMV